MMATGTTPRQPFPLAGIRLAMPSEGRRRSTLRLGLQCFVVLIDTHAARSRRNFSRAISSVSMRMCSTLVRRIVPPGYHDNARLCNRRWFWRSFAQLRNGADDGQDEQHSVTSNAPMVPALLFRNGRASRRTQSCFTFASLLCNLLLCRRCAACGRCTCDYSRQ